MKMIAKYIKDSYNELVYKVTWPTRAEIANSAIVVMTASVIMAMIIFGIDQGFEHIINLIYGTSTGASQW